MSNEIELQEQIVKMLRTVFDPEIPVNVYDLGLIYKVDIEGTTAHIDMTLTAPNCPAADFIIEDVRMKVESIEGIECASEKTFSVQYNPESAPGAQDSAYLFDKFIKLMEENHNA